MHRLTLSPKRACDITFHVPMCHKLSRDIMLLRNESSLIEEAVPEELIH